MLQPPGDLGFEQEAGAAVRVVGAFGSELLEGDLAVELGVEGHGDLPQAPPGVRPEDREPRAGGRRALGIGERGLGVVLSGGCGGRDAVERGLDLGVGDPLQLGAEGAEPVGGRQALLGVAAMSRQVLVDELLQEVVPRRGQGLLLDQDPAQRFGFLQDPGVHRRDQGVARRRSSSAPPGCRRAGCGRRDSWAHPLRTNLAKGTLAGRWTKPPRPSVSYTASKLSSGHDLVDCIEGLANATSYRRNSTD